MKKTKCLFPECDREQNSAIFEFRCMWSCLPSLQVARKLTNIAGWCNTKRLKPDWKTGLSWLSFVEVRARSTRTATMYDNGSHALYTKNIRFCFFLWFLCVCILYILCFKFSHLLFQNIVSAVESHCFIKANNTAHSITIKTMFKNCYKTSKGSI